MRTIKESLQSFYQEPVNEGILDVAKSLVGWALKKIGGWPVFIRKDDATGKDAAFAAISPIFAGKAISEGYAGPCAHFAAASFLGRLAGMFGVKSSAAAKIIEDFAKTKKSIFESVDTNNLANICEAFSLSGNNTYGPDVETKALKFHLKTAIKNPGFATPLMIWGAPGIGKTAIINAVVNEFFGNKNIIAKNLSEMTADDFSLPNVVKDDKGDTLYVEDLPKSWLPVYKVEDDPKLNEINDNIANGGDDKGKEGQGGVIFFDEISRCRKDVQGVVLTLIQDRMLAGGKYKLGSKWAIVAASNRQFDDPNFDINFSTALGNRFNQINFVPSLKDWLGWAEKKTYMSKTVLNFLKFNEKYWYNMNPDDEDERVFASPRAWENCCKTVYAIKNDPDAAGEDPELIETVIRQAIQGIVGDKAATEFLTFMKLCDSVDVEALTNVPKDYKKAPKLDKSIRTDLKYYMVDVAISALNVDKGCSPAELLNIFSWLGESKDESVAANGWSIIDKLFPDIKFKSGNPELKKYDKYKDHWDDYAKAFETLVKLIPSIDKDITLDL